MKNRRKIILAEARKKQKKKISIADIRAERKENAGSQPNMLMRMENKAVDGIHSAGKAVDKTMNRAIQSDQMAVTQGAEDNPAIQEFDTAKQQGI